MQSQENCPKTNEPCPIREACTAVETRTKQQPGIAYLRILKALNFIGICDGMIGFYGPAEVMRECNEYEQKLQQDQRLNVQANEVLNINCNGDDCIVESALSQSRLDLLAQSVGTVLSEPER